MGSRITSNEKAQSFVAKHNGKATTGTFSDAASFADINFNCTAGGASIDALQPAGTENLKVKILVNPLDFL